MTATAKRSLTRAKVKKWVARTYPWFTIAHNDGRGGFLLRLRTKPRCEREKLKEGQPKLLTVRRGRFLFTTDPGLYWGNFLQH